MENIIELVRTELKNNIDAKRLANRNYFFKEEIELYGVKVPTVHKISKDLFQSISTRYLNIVRHSGNQDILKNLLLHAIGRITYEKNMFQKILKYLRNGSGNM